MSELQTYLELFFVFFRIGAVTFGGGLAMLPILDRDLVQRRKWITAEELVDYFAIGQSTPGIIAVNVATFAGYSRRGIRGSIVATAGIVTPSVIIITLLAAFLENFTDIPQVISALRGINVVVAVLLIQAVFSLGRKTLVGPIAISIGIVSFLAITAFNVPGVVVVLCSAILGILVKYRRGAQK